MGPVTGSVLDAEGPAGIAQFLTQLRDVPQP